MASACVRVPSTRNCATEKGFAGSGKSRHGTMRPPARGTCVRCRIGWVGPQTNPSSVRCRSARSACARQKGRVSARYLLGARRSTKAARTVRAEARTETFATDLGRRLRSGCTSSFAANGGGWRRSLRISGARATAGYTCGASGRTSLYLATLPSIFGARA
jgi:hypothetical protein